MDDWQACIDKLAQTDGTIMVVGGTDVGKTTFCTALVRAAFSLKKRVAVVDSDVGQSEIGPPTTIGLGLVDRDIQRLADLKTHAMYFVGATSPVGHLTECVVGTKKMIDRALHMGAELVIVDTTGLVHGNIGRKLKTLKIELVEPDSLVFIERARELEGLATSICVKNLYRVGVPEQIRTKSQMFRSNRRREKFASYFQNAHEFEFSLDGMKLQNTRLFYGKPLSEEEMQPLREVLRERILSAERATDGVTVWYRETLGFEEKIFIKDCIGTVQVHFIKVEILIGLFVGLINKDGQLLDVGILRSFDLVEKNVHLYTPLQEVGTIAGIIFGRERLLDDFSEASQSLMPYGV